MNEKGGKSQSELINGDGRSREQEALLDSGETVSLVEAFREGSPDLSADLTQDLSPVQDVPGAEESKSVRQAANSSLTLSFAQKYEIMNLLGKGGMSEVYQARHKVLNKIVAVKVLDVDRASDLSSLRRFRQEAQAASSLNHPSILAVHDFGECEDGRPFIEMDYVDGVTLSDLIKKEGALGLQRFLQIMSQITAGLSVAHQNGIVHRDLKPSNIMLSSGADGQEVVRILDFGIAKFVNSSSADSRQQLTQTGEIFGSPLYMSPEQCTGSPVDSRADIYSLGCVMYEALSGSVPHAGETVFETIHKHMSASPAPLQAPQIAAEFRAKLETILLRCLAKMPEDRFQSIQELDAELRSLSLKSKAGLLNAFGDVWGHAMARRRAASRSRMPAALVTLMTVAVFSMVSLLAMFSAQQRLNSDIARLNHSRLILSEISLAQTTFIKMGNAMRVYAQNEMFNNSPENLKYAREQLEKTGAETEKALHKVEALLGEDQDFIRSYRSEWRGRVFDAPSATKNALMMLPGGSSADDPESRRVYMKLSGVLRDASRSLNDMTRKAREVERERLGKLSGTQEWINYLSLLCIALNAAVVVVLIVYFARGTPKRIARLAQRAASLSRRKAGGKPAGNDELADLDLVLHELAAALSEAEEREKLLLLKLQEKEGEQKDA